MTKRNWRLMSAVVALATCLPLPAVAEVHGAAKCANASWSALAAGECGLTDLHVLRKQPQAEAADLELVAFPIPEVPESQTFALMLVGLGALALVARKRRGRTE